MATVRTNGSRVYTVSIVLLLLGIAVILISLNTGTIHISPVEVITTLFGYGSADQELVLFEYRMPRILITMLAGIGLGVSGAILQGLSRNALADPGILGLHAGAAFGLIVFISFFQSLEGPLSLFVPLFTFAGGVLTAAIIVWLAYDRHEGILPIRLILVGIAVAAGLSAITLFLSLRLDEEIYNFAARWLVGSVWGRDWEHVYALLPWMLIFLPYALVQSRSLDAFMLGDDVAASIGVPIQMRRLMLLATAVAISSASVAMVGGIGFIGLAAPHLARRLVGSMHRDCIPVSGLIGLVILVAADTIGRTLFLPSSIPAGVIVAAVGAPYFLYLLVRTKT